MTITLKPLHLVVIAFLVGLLLTTVIVLAVSGGSDEPAQTVVVVTATFDPSTLSTSDAPVTSTSTVATPAPPAPTPPPEPQPVRSCAEIRAAGTYLNDVERDYFLASCQTPITGSSQAAPSSPSAPVSAPAVPTVAPAAQPATDPAITEAERSYRGRAEGVTGAWLTRFRQLPKTIGSRAALLNYGATAGGWANQMDNLAPVPLRFQRAHDQLQAALRALEALTRVEPVVFSTQYLNQLNSHIIAVNTALNDYSLVVGVPIPAATQ